MTCGINESEAYKLVCMSDKELIQYAAVHRSLGSQELLNELINRFQEILFRMEGLEK